MGLGSVETTSLAQARELVDKWRTEVAKGRDPILSREKGMRTAPRADTSFETIMAEAFEAHKAELKDDGIAGRWTSPLVYHVLPKIGRGGRNWLKDGGVKASR